MSDSEEENQSPAVVPEWQLGASHDDDDDDRTADAPPPPHEQLQQDKLDVARQFLEEDEVKAAPRDKKVAFLKSKGIEDADIQNLLGRPEETAIEARTTTPPPPPPPPPAEPAAEAQSNNDDTRAHPPILSAGNRPPVVTYPEFLTKPKRPPPLVTTNGLLSTLYAFAGLSTMLYGTSNYVVAPMVESLTDARADLHQATSKKLDAIVSKLEKTVSVVPQPKTTSSSTTTVATVPDESSEVDDPSEMFHRDIGTQTTSLPTSPSLCAAQSTTTSTSSSTTSDLEPESKRQAQRLSKLSESLAALKSDLDKQGGGLQDVKSLLDLFRDDLDGMTYGRHGDFVGGFDIYGKLKRSEPEDEIRKARDNIRRIKGVLLSTRNFPASTR